MPSIDAFIENLKTEEGNTALEVAFSYDEKEDRNSLSFLAVILADEEGRSAYFTFTIPKNIHTTENMLKADVRILEKGGEDLPPAALEGEGENFELTATALFEKIKTTEAVRENLPEGTLDFMEKCLEEKKLEL